jgi:hypothetical protein
MSTKKCTRIVIKKMAAMPMLAGVGLMMVCCSSSSVASMMMGGGDSGGGDSESSTGPTPPKAEHIVVDEQHAIENFGGYEELGPGNSVEECRKLAYDANYAAFGWRKEGSWKPNSCWAIVDGKDTKNKIEAIENHAISCVTAGEDVKEGCETTKDNVLRERHLVGGSAYEELGPCNSVESCRTLAKSKGFNHFGFREAGSWSPNSGWVVKNQSELKTLNIESIKDHVMGCTDPTKKFPKEC